jgi:DNA repair/transcription protein MET18/MMS19
MSTELEGSVEGILEQIWLSDVQDTSGDYEVRSRGLMVYLHVSLNLTRISPRLTFHR